MTMMTDAQKQIQHAQDMLEAVANQRNAAQNECVQLAAQLVAANRRIAELEKVNADVTAAFNEADALNSDAAPKPIQNGDGAALN